MRLNRGGAAPRRRAARGRRGPTSAPAWPSPRHGLPAAGGEGPAQPRAAGLPGRAICRRAPGLPRRGRGVHRARPRHAARSSRSTGPVRCWPPGLFTDADGELRPRGAPVGRAAARARTSPRRSSPGPRRRCWRSGRRALGRHAAAGPYPFAAARQPPLGRAGAAARAPGAQQFAGRPGALAGRVRALADRAARVDSAWPRRPGSRPWSAARPWLAGRRRRRGQLRTGRRPCPAARDRLDTRLLWRLAGRDRPRRGPTAAGPAHLRAGWPRCPSTAVRLGCGRPPDRCGRPRAGARAAGPRSARSGGGPPRSSLERAGRGPRRCCCRRCGRRQDPSAAAHVPSCAASGARLARARSWPGLAGSRGLRGRRDELRRRLREHGWLGGRHGDRRTAGRSARSAPRSATPPWSSTSVGAGRLRGARRSPVGAATWCRSVALTPAPGGAPAAARRPRRRPAGRLLTGGLTAAWPRRRGGTRAALPAPAAGAAAPPRG